MTKVELISEIAKETEFSKSNVEHFIAKFSDVIKQNVKKGIKVSIVDLGSFERVYHKTRNGVNPKTGKRIVIPAKFVPKFKPAKAFKELVLE